MEFLRALDDRLDEKNEMVVIGGAAAALRYGATRATKDIDTWNNISSAVERAAVGAREATGLDIPIERAAVADAPYFYEERLHELSGIFQKLVLFVPERHDLALMKVVRGDRHDVDVIAEIHENEPLDLQILLDRFEEEMSHVIKDEQILRLQFRLLIERLFGAAAAKSVKRKRAPGSGGTRV